MASQSKTGPNGKQAQMIMHHRGRAREKFVTLEKDLLVCVHSSGGHMGLSDSSEQAECFG